jgi:hypothetical protein
MAGDLKGSLVVASGAPAAGLPPSPPAKTAREPNVSYDPDLAELILTEISDGRTLTEICDRAGMPSRSSIHRWVRDNFDFQKRYLSAVEIRAHSRVDEICKINALVAAGKMPPAEAKVICDNLRWLASKEDPRRFGDRLTQELLGKDGKDLIPEQKMSDVEVVRWMAFKFAQAERALKQEEASALALGPRDG